MFEISFFFKGFLVNRGMAKWSLLILLVRSGLRLILG